MATLLPCSFYIFLQTSLSKHVFTIRKQKLIYLLALFLYKLPLVRTKGFRVIGAHINEIWLNQYSFTLDVFVLLPPTKFSAPITWNYSIVNRRTIQASWFSRGSLYALRVCAQNKLSFRPRLTILSIRGAQVLSFLPGHIRLSRGTLSVEGLVWVLQSCFFCE